MFKTAIDQNDQKQTKMAILLLIICSPNIFANPATEIIYGTYIGISDGH